MGWGCMVLAALQVGDSAQTTGDSQQASSGTYEHTGETMKYCKASLGR